jgi:hypothetical protein
MLIEAGASLGFCSYLDAPKTDGSSWKRIISSPADPVAGRPPGADAAAGAPAALAGAAAGAGAAPSMPASARVGEDPAAKKMMSPGTATKTIL